MTRARGLLRSTFDSQTAYQYCGSRATKPERRELLDDGDDAPDFTRVFFLYVISKYSFCCRSERPFCKVASGHTGDEHGTYMNTNHSSFTHEEVIMIESYQGCTPKIHEAAFVHASAVVIGEVSIGSESSIWPNTTLRADDGHIVIGSQTSIQDGTVIHMTSNLSDTTVGNRVTVGHQVLLHGCQIEDECLIGMGSVLLDNVHVGHHSLIGAGSLVLQRTQIPPYSLVLGSPAKVVRSISEVELEQIQYSWKHYVERANIYKSEVKSL